MCDPHYRIPGDAFPDMEDVLPTLAHAARCAQCAERKKAEVCLVKCGSQWGGGGGGSGPRKQTPPPLLPPPFVWSIAGAGVGGTAALVSSGTTAIATRSIPSSKGEHIRAPGRTSFSLDGTPPPQQLEAPVRKTILQMHTPARSSQCWSRQTPAWTRSVHLDAPGQRHGQQPRLRDGQPPE